MNATANTTAVSLQDQCAALVDQCAAYATAYKLREDASATMESFRVLIVETLRGWKAAKMEWKAIQPAIKQVLTEAGANDIAKKVQVYKICYEYKILPTDLNATRLSSAKSWIAWSGNRVENTYQKSKPANNGGKAVETPTTGQTPVNGTPVPSEVKTTVLQPQAAPVKKATAPKSEADGTGSETALKPFELFQTRFVALAHDECMPAYIHALAGLLKVKDSELSAAMSSAYADLAKAMTGAAK